MNTVLHVRPSRELRNSYSKISELVKRGDRVVITVNGVGDGVFISMADFNEYEKLRQVAPLLTSEERADLTKDLKECLDYSNTPGAKFHSHEEAEEMLGLKS